MKLRMQAAAGGRASTSMHSPSKDSNIKSFRTRVMVALFHGWECLAFLVLLGTVLSLAVRLLYGGEISLNSIVQQRFALLRGGQGGQLPSIPRIIHQTWKNEMVTRTSAQRIKSWLKHNPGWEYKFWSNAAGRQFMAEHYPEHLPMYDGYKQDIKRADAIRYFLLDHFGGVYADLDFECLQPLAPLTSNFSCIVGQEPYPHSHVLYDKDRLICNAIMMSAPGHPLWATVIDTLELRKGIVKGGKHVMDATGPRMLNDALQTYEQQLHNRTDAGAGAGEQQERDRWERVQVPEPEVLYPYFDDKNPHLRTTCKARTSLSSARVNGTCDWLKRNHFLNRPIDKRSFAVHHWMHSWVGWGYYGYDDVNVTQLVSDIQAGRKTVLDEQESYYEGGLGNMYEYEGGGEQWDPSKNDLAVECEGDKKKFCSGVKPGGGRTHKCVLEHKANLSKACLKAEFTPHTAGIYGEQISEEYQTPSDWDPQLNSLAAECEGDKKKFCSGVKPGGGRTHKCVLEHKANLSRLCFEAEFTRNINAHKVYGGEGGTHQPAETETSEVLEQSGGLDWDPRLSALAAECEGDKKKFCSGVEPGGGRTHKCVLEHKANLSRPCFEAEFVNNKHHAKAVYGTVR